MSLLIPQLGISLVPATLLLKQDPLVLLKLLRPLVHPADFWLPADLSKPLAIGEVRELQRFASRKPVGQKMVALLPMAEQWRPEVANALLKLLEEPTPDLYLAVLADQAESLLPTVRSRLTILAPLANSATIESRKLKLWQKNLLEIPLTTTSSRKKAQNLLYLYPLIHSGLKDEMLLQSLNSSR